MKKSCIYIWVALVSLACQNGGQDEPDPVIDKTELIKACQYIQGGGSTTTGGKGGQVFYVSSLSDEMDKSTGLPMRGTLRYAVEYQSGARVVLFRVAGTIHLNSPIHVRNANISILGQSAPGDGVCVADYPIIVGTNNVIIRFIRCRLGDASKTSETMEDYDALSVNDSKNVVIDHCSCSWSVDECVSCYGNENFTLQYCFITESLRKSVHAKGNHGYGGIWGGKNASFHHNLLAHHDSRNPRFDHDYVDTRCGGPIDYVNNVVYNWGNNSSYGGEGTSKGAGGRHINMVKNYYKYGPSTKKSVRSRLVNPWTSCSNCTDHVGGSVLPPQIFLVDNTMDGDAEVTADNWKGSTEPKSVSGVDTRWTAGMTLLDDEQLADSAYETVLTKAGCSLHRDAVDSRIVEEVRNRSGKLIDSQTEVGGWPELTEGTLPDDSDGDGIPDEWERKYGLNPTLISDGKASTLVDGVPNYEVYLNAIVAHLY